MNQICAGLVQFIGDTHRPVAILLVANAFFIDAVLKPDALVLGAIGAVLTGLFWGKSAENMTQIKQNAEVQKEAVKQGQPTGV